MRFRWNKSVIGWWWWGGGEGEWPGNSPLWIWTLVWSHGSTLPVIENSSTDPNTRVTFETHAFSGIDESRGLFRAFRVSVLSSLDIWGYLTTRVAAKTCDRSWGEIFTYACIVRNILLLYWHLMKRNCRDHIAVLYGIFIHALRIYLYVAFAKICKRREGRRFLNVSEK